MWWNKINPRFLAHGGHWLAGWLLLAGPALAQSPWAFEVRIPLPGSDQITWQAGAQSVQTTLDSGNRLVLMPPDMAQVDPGRIQLVQTDTLPPQGNSPARYVAHCVVDTLFFGERLFLTDVPVEVPYFADGTFAGTSRLGWHVFDGVGVCRGPQVTDGGEPSLVIQRVAAAAQPLEARFQQLLTWDESQASLFPLQAGDIEEVRLIRCDDAPSTRQRLATMKRLLSAHAQFCAGTSVDPAVPPAAALARIQHPVTIRYFEAQHAPRAEAMAQLLAYLLAIPSTEIFVENMVPHYGNHPPVLDYLELWFR
jgi:hypothetical protein